MRRGIWILSALLLAGCAIKAPPTRHDGQPVDLTRFRADLAECEARYDLQDRPIPQPYRQSAGYYTRASQALLCMDERGWEYGRR